MINNFIYMFNKKISVIRFFILMFLIFISTMLINIANSYNPYYIPEGSTIIFYSFFVLYLVSLLIPFGYGVDCMNALMANQEELPPFNQKSAFKNGIKCILALSLLAVVVICIFGILGFVSNFLISKNCMLWAFIVSVFSFLILFLLIFNLIISLYYFVKTKNLLSFIMFKSNYNKLNDIRTGRYLICTILTVLTVITAFCFRTILLLNLYFYGFIGMLIYAILVSFMWTYILLVSMPFCIKVVNSHK